MGIKWIKRKGREEKYREKEMELGHFRGEVKT